MNNTLPETDEQRRERLAAERLTRSAKPFTMGSRMGDHLRGGTCEMACDAPCSPPDLEPEAV